MHLNKIKIRINTKSIDIDTNYIESVIVTIDDHVEDITELIDWQVSDREQSTETKFTSISFIHESVFPNSISPWFDIIINWRIDFITIRSKIIYYIPQTAFATAFERTEEDNEKIEISF